MVNILVFICLFMASLPYWVAQVVFHVRRYRHAAGR
jgi:hypothetical protein